VPLPATTASTCWYDCPANWRVTTPENGLVSAVAVFTAVPCTENEAEELRPPMFAKFNGDTPKGLAAETNEAIEGEHSCPIAGATKQAAEEETPRKMKFKSKRIVGAAANVRKLVRTIGVFTACTSRLRSAALPAVAARGAKDPVELGSTRKVPVPPPAGNQSIVVNPIATEPVISSVPEMGAAGSRAPAARMRSVSFSEFLIVMFFARVTNAVRQQVTWMV
jgi:rubredoxin